MKNCKRKLVMILISALIVSFIAACQPTPESEAVVGKGNGELESKVLEGAISSPAEKTTLTDDRIVWNETKTANVENEGDYTVSVSIDAKTPDIPDRVSAYLIEPKEFSIDFMKMAAGYLMKGDIFDGKETKEDVTKEILDFKEDISSHTIREGYQANADDWLSFLEKRYNDAADSNTEAKYEYTTLDGDKNLSLKSYPDENIIMKFSTYMGADGFTFRINDFNRSFQYLSDISGENIQANGTEMTYFQARTEADKAMTALFEEPFALVHSNIIDKINFQEYLWNEDEETCEGQAYVFFYTREYDDIPSLFIKKAPTYVTEQTEYAAPYGREGACVVVDDRGIAQMRYESYSNTIKMLNENVALMPFDDILDRFKDGVFYHNLWGAGGTLVKINITDIEFGLVREPVKDNPDQFMMVPAWNFIGNIGDDTWDDRYGYGQNKSILALNAIDGSIITDYQDMTDPK